MQSSELSSSKGLDLFTKHGVFYVRVPHRSMPDTIEVALHGIGTREEAIAAAQMLACVHLEPQPSESEP